jgi:hypothetical protein
MQLTQLGIISSSTGSTREAFLVIGDSIAAGLTGHTASTLPASGTAYEFDRNTDTILEFGAGAGITGFSFNSKSPWAKFCIDYYANTGRKALIINRGASASTISPALSGLVGNDWQTTGTNYNAAVTAVNTCLGQAGLTQLTGIIVNLGINDVQGQSGTGSFSVAQVSTYLTTLIDNLRTDFGTNVPILFIQVGRSAGITVSARLTGVRNAIKQACVTYSNCSIAGSLGGFKVAGLYEDDIHPNRDGNDVLGSMPARWFSNSAITNKWARSIISACHYTDPSAGRKTKIVNFIATYESVYLSMDMFYETKGHASSVKGEICTDWAFLCAPESDGSFTFTAGTGVITNGTTTIFNTGYDQSLCAISVLTNDYAWEIKLDNVVTASGVTAALTGSATASKNNIFRQLNTNGINYAVISATSYTYAGENNFSVASWMAMRTASNAISLWKNGVSVDTRTDAAATPPTGNWALGCFRNAGTNGSFFAGTFTRMVLFKPSLVSNKAQFVTDLNTLQAP